MSVVDQLEQFLRDHPALAPDPLAAAASALASEIDAGQSVAQSAVAFQKLMVELRAMLPAERAVGKLDELKKRRAAKLRATAT
jgi:hypothetical protein